MLNKVMLIGNLGSDVEVKSTSSGSAVANVNLATEEKWKDSNGNMQSDTEWHKLVFWGKLAEVAGGILKKGDKIYVEGRLKTRKWTNQNGVEIYTTEIHCKEMKRLKWSDGESEAPRGGGRTQGGGRPRSTGGDIPF